MSPVVLLEGTFSILKNTQLDKMWCQIELLQQVFYSSLYLTQVYFCQYSNVNF